MLFYCRLATRGFQDLESQFHFVQDVACYVTHLGTYTIST